MDGLKLLVEGANWYCWYKLLFNPNAIEIIRKYHNDNKYKHFLNWSYISQNPNIFTYDYYKIREYNKHIKKELIELFTLEKISKNGAKFDPEKAKWFNHQQLMLKPNAEIARGVLDGRADLGRDDRSGRAARRDSQRGLWTLGHFRPRARAA